MRHLPSWHGAFVYVDDFIFLEKSQSQINNFIDSLKITLEDLLFSKTNGVETRLHKIWILEESQMPAVIFECGFISDRKDVQNVKSKQTEIAMSILDGISSYLSNKN